MWLLFNFFVSLLLRQILSGYLGFGEINASVIGWTFLYSLPLSIVMEWAFKDQSWYHLAWFLLAMTKRYKITSKEAYGEHGGDYDAV